jgi:transposase
MGAAWSCNLCILLEGVARWPDDYEGYGAIARTADVKHLACWAHARRGFVEAAKMQTKGKRGRADDAIELIGWL